MSINNRENEIIQGIREKNYSISGVIFREFLEKERTAQAAGEFIASFIKDNPQSNISFATGATMEPVYKSVRNSGVNATEIRAFHLDEYIGANPEVDEESFVQYVRSNVVTPLNIRKAYYLDGTAVNPEEEAERYEKLLQQYPTDLAILGIGPGGHIAFNEAGTPFHLGVHVQKLSPETIQRDVERGQPLREYALTQGPMNIIMAKNIIVVLYGTSKGEILQECFDGSISHQLPASILRLPKIAGKVTVFLDEFAGKKMRTLLLK